MHQQICLRSFKQTSLPSFWWNLPFVNDEEFIVCFFVFHSDGIYLLFPEATNIFVPPWKINERNCRDNCSRWEKKCSSMCCTCKTVYTILQHLRFISRNNLSLVALVGLHSRKSFLGHLNVNRLKQLRDCIS